VEKFGLTWPEKDLARSKAFEPIGKILSPMKNDSANWDTTQNLIIEGDNLDALKLLQKSYYGKVKMIYIDPPYNTGKEFIYPDNFHEGLRDYLRYSGQVDGDGRKVSSNSEGNGRYHSNWLSMMYPRLFLARNLLRNDGIIFVSIDDHEVHNLIALMNEIFGEENFLNVFTWINNLKGRQISNYGAASTKEYVVSFAKSIEFTSPLFAPSQLLKEWMPAIYKGFDYELKSDDRGPYVLKNELYNSNSAFNEETRPNLVYDIYYNPETRAVKTEPVSSTHVHPGFIKVAPKRNNDGRHRYHAFRWSRPKVEAEAHDLEFVNSKSAWRVYTKVRQVGIAAVKDSVMGIHTADGTSDLAATGLPASAFDYPKPVRIPQLFVLSSSEQDDIVLDFFAGLGTTGHAVIAANASDGGNRRYIMVQLPEPVKSDQFDTIADITRERMRRAGKIISTESDKPVDIGFRAYSIDDASNDDTNQESQRLLNAGLELTEQLSSDELDTDTLDDVLLAT